ncbi:hypothetical protein B9086_017860 [Morganella morganii subsp. morganii]|nr:hypothetical protein AL531_06855 [Morganella morganii]RNW09379.1 hypothetical protein B9086_017860 [Morganella morganii subsp. morganii]AZP25618.1 hypothetical protein D8758_09005 [Morganella morganii]PHH08186.1 hypothetical protein CRX48_06465 [Morganella morganii]RAX27563.1 hypothetical protein DQ401_01860 [Morganella morganii]
MIITLLCEFFAIKKPATGAGTVLWYSRLTDMHAQPFRPTGKIAPPTIVQFVHVHGMSSV